MSAENLIGMVEATFVYMQSLGDWYKDPAGVDAIREVKDRMVRDLESFSDNPTKTDLTELCREWRASRIEIEGDASYPPDIFIESVCEMIKIS